LYTGKTFLLTGATKGIGKQIAISLATNNAQLIAIARSNDDLIKLKNDLQNKGGPHLYYSLDVSNELLVKQIFDEINQQVSLLDGIINCAGSFGSIGKFEETSPSQFLESIQINLMGSYNICYHGFKLLSKAPKGKIINFAGGGVTGTFPNYSGYACSKIALTKLTENLSVEYPTLNINIIAPGFVKTDLANQTIMAGYSAGSFYEKTKKMLLDGGIDVKFTVDLVNYLLSDEANGISGKLISAPWDQWKEVHYQKEIKENPDFCTIRRIDNKYFTSIASDI
jgi:short-subunit dehydrogenase